MTDNDLLLAWYRYAATAQGFIGAALKQHRDKASLTEQQQRIAIGILDSKYDLFWLRLQAMPLPRRDQFTTDLERIVEYLSHELSIDAKIDLQRLADLIIAGLT